MHFTDFGQQVEQFFRYTVRKNIPARRQMTNLRMAKLLWTPLARLDRKF